METYRSLKQEGALADFTENWIKMLETLASCGGLYSWEILWMVKMWWAKLRSYGKNEVQGTKAHEVW